MVIVLNPLYLDANYMKECENSFKRSIQTSEECISKSSVYFLQQGLD